MEYKLPDNTDQLKNQIAQLQNELLELRGDMDDTNTPMVRYGEANGLSNPAPTAIKFRRILKGHYGKIYSMHWGVNSKHLVSASQDGKLLIWNAHSTHKVHAIPLKSSWVMTCAMSTEGNPDSHNSSQYVACGGLDNLCTVYKLPAADDAPTAKNKPLAELAHHEGYLSCCRFIRDEKIITSSGDSTCILWDIATGQVMRSFTEHTGDVMSVSIRDDNSFVSGACDASARFWDFRDARAVAQYKPESKDGGNLKYKQFPGHDSDINSVQMFPDGNAFASGSDDSTCRLFDIRAFRQLQRFGNDKILCGITSVDFSMSGKYLIAGYDDEKCLLWDTISGQAAGDVSGHDNRVSCLGVSPDGKALATGSWDTYLKIWA